MAMNRQSVIKHPLARSERLLVENIDDETVIYDEESKVAHALKPLAAAVFLYADGKNSAADIAELAGYRLNTSFTVAQIDEAVAELESCALLEAPEFEGGVSRRDALKRFGAVGVAAGAGTMLISSIAAPLASAAGLASNGAPYLCGTGSNPITGNRGYPSVSYPQPSASSGWGSYIGAACGSGTYQGCLYHDSTNPQIPSAICSAGFCTDSYDDYIYSATSQSACSGVTFCEASDSAGDHWYYTGVPGSTCLGGGGFCVDSSGTYQSGRTQSNCRGNGLSWITGADYTYRQVTGEWTTGTLVSNGCSGTYQCVPCDGSVNGGSHYQCCEVVCVPDGTSVPGAILTKNAQNLPAPYTTIPYAGIGYGAKYCTANNCNNTGDCS
jgi:hypothetical protein